MSLIEPLGDHGRRAVRALRTRPGCLFVRVSRASVLDVSLAPWLRVQLSTLGLEPKRLCLQVTEEVAARHPTETRTQARALKDMGLRFALEHFGIGIDPLSLLDTLPLDFIKVDGSLMQGLTGDELLQSKVGSLIDAARGRDIEEEDHCRTRRGRQHDGGAVAAGRAAPAGLPDPGARGSHHQHHRDTDGARAAGQPGPGDPRVGATSSRSTLR